MKKLFGIILGAGLIASGVIMGISCYNIPGDASLVEWLVAIILFVMGIKLILKTLSVKNAKFQNENIISNIFAVFGATKCRISESLISDNCVVDVFCLFGGADIYIPENVNVKINSLCLFGGISDKRNIISNSDNMPVITINGFCLFGGADIKGL